MSQVIFQVSAPLYRPLNQSVNKIKMLHWMNISLGVVSECVVVSMKILLQHWRGCMRFFSKTVWNNCPILYSKLWSLLPVSDGSEGLYSGGLQERSQGMEVRIGNWSNFWCFYYSCLILTILETKQRQKL